MNPSVVIRGGTEPAARGTISRPGHRQRGAASTHLNKVGPLSARSSFTSLGSARIHDANQSLRSFSEAFHSLAISAGRAGLVASAYGQSSSKRKSENVRKDGEKIHV